MSEERYHFELEVYIEDTDLFGMVYYANYLKYYERARSQWLKAHGVSLEEVAKQGFQLLVREVKATWLQPARLGQRLVVTTQLIQAHRSIAKFEQQILNCQQSVMNRATVKVIALDDQGKLCHILPLINGEGAKHV